LEVIAVRFERSTSTGIAMQIDIQQFLDQHLPKVGWGTIIASCFTFIGCIVRFTWSGGKAFTEVTDARADLTEIKEDVRITKEETTDLREDLRLLRPVLEDLTRAVNSNTNVLSELKGQLQGRAVWK
jgi:hypothetical protein